MIKAELIEALRTFPDDEDVCFDDGENEWDIEEVEEEDGVIWLSPAEDDSDVIDVEAEEV